MEKAKDSKPDPIADLGESVVRAEKPSKAKRDIEAMTDDIMRRFPKILARLAE